jgi:hypothetical protein
MNVSIKLKGDVFTIHINELLHLYICEPIISIQSFNEQDKFFKIEYQTKNQTILTEYDCPLKWTQILKELNKHV